MPLLIVDGMSVFRTVAGQAAHLDRGYAYSFMIQLTSVIKKFKCNPVMVCWEGGYGGREKIYAGYKKDRKPTPELIRDERKEIQTLLTHLGVDQLVAPGYEADDLVAFLANTVPNDTIIYSNDKDVLQLINDRVSVYQRVRGEKKSSERMLITGANFSRLTGWASPDDWFLAQLALGDKIDGIPKIEGVGEGVIYAYLMGMDVPQSKRDRLDAFYNESAQLEMNRKLMDLRDVRSLPDVILTQGCFDRRKAKEFLQEIGFASIVARFPEWVATYEASCADQK